jgi:hypothetical protein
LARLKRFLLEFDVDFGVAICRVQTDVAEPPSDHIDFDTGFEEMNGCCVTKDMGRDQALVLAPRDVYGVTPDELE